MPVVRLWLHLFLLLSHCRSHEITILGRKCSLVGTYSHKRSYNVYMHKFPFYPCNIHFIIFLSTSCVHSVFLSTSRTHGIFLSSYAHKLSFYPLCVLTVFLSTRMHWLSFYPVTVHCCLSIHARCTDILSIQSWCMDDLSIQT